MNQDLQTSKPSSEALSLKGKPQEEAGRAADIVSFKYLEEGFLPVARMQPEETQLHLVAQAVKACRVLAKSPPEAAITEFSYRILEEHPSMTFGDTQLFWRKFTAGELNDKAFSFAGPGLPEIMECWEKFQMQRAGEFERKHEHRKMEGQKMTKEANEFYRAYIERAEAEHEQRQQRRERIARKNAEIKAHEGVVFTDYKRYLKACEDRGLTQEQGAGFLPYPQYLLDRQCVHSYLIAYDHLSPSQNPSGQPAQADRQRAAGA